MVFVQDAALFDAFNERECSVAGPYNNNCQTFTF